MIRNDQPRHYQFGVPSLQTGAYRTLIWGNALSRRIAAGLRHFALAVAVVAVISGGLFGFVPQVQAQNDFQIQTATPAFIGAGANGATLVLDGSLSGLQDSGFQVCFYNGVTSSIPITPNFTNNVASIDVSGTTIQGVPKGNFTAANGYSVSAQIYVASQGATTCDGTFDATLTNSYSETISEPLLGVYGGPTNVPQTNSKINAQAPPVNIVLSGNNFTSGTTVTFGSYGTLTPTLISPTSISVAVPTGFAAGDPGTSAPISVCGANSYCTGVDPTVTLTVTALVPSTGTLVASPSPTTTIGTTTLTAQFKRDTANSANAAEPGAPSGVVAFTAAGNSVGTAPLVLDTTATFVATTSTTQIPAAAIPVIAPSAGTYTSAQTITIADATPGAKIYYTADGTAPTAASTLYSGPFVITTSQTISAVAIAAGYRASAVASQAYVIRILMPVGLAFVSQPVNTATGVVIAPPVTVAVVDVNGNTVTNSSIPVTLSFGNNPGDAGTLLGTLTQNAVNGIATFPDLSIVTIADGYTLLASGGGLNQGTSNAFNITPYPIAVKLFDPLIGVTSTLPGTFTLSHVAPQGGVVVSLASSSTSLVSVSPATVTIAAGQTTGNFTYTGVQPAPGTPPPANNNLGVATITASAPNYLAGSADVTETYSLVSLGTIPPVAPAQVLDLALSLATNAPAGGVTIHFTSSDPTVATITSSVFVPAGQRTAAANPQITGIKIGTTTVTATAQGYAPDTRSVNVTVVASFNPTGITINMATSNIPTLNISAPAQAGGITFTLSSDDTTKVTVPASVTIPAGQTSVAVPITGIAPTSGNVAVRADSAGVTEAVLNVNVSSALSFYYSTETAGVNLEVSNNVYLPASSPTPVTVTITSSNPAVALISKSGTTVGSASLTYTNVTSAGYLATFYIQGKTTGTTTLTVTATGYTAGTSTITVNPSGFVFYGGYNSGISTTTLATPYGLTIYPAILNNDLSYYTTSTVSPGVGPVSLSVTSATTSVGTISTSPVIFNPGDSSQQTNFKPASAGTTVISLGTPSVTSFNKSTSFQSFTATVTTPALSFYYTTETDGVNMQVNNNVYLPDAPASAQAVTVTSSDPTIAVLSTSATTVGSGSISFPGITSAGYVATFYIQGKRVGTVTLTAHTPGFTDATSTITVNPSGFVFSGGYNNGISTTTFSSPSALYVYPAILNTDLSYYTTSTISPGVPQVSIPVTSATTSVGTISTSPIVFNPGDSSQSTNFQPVGAGTTTIALGTPSITSFSKSVTYQSFTATVTAPALSFYYGTETGGVNLQIGNNVYLPVAPPSAETFTITSSNPAVALLSKDGTTVGSSSISFPGITAAGYQLSFYIQGKTTGTTTLTVSGNGYTSATSTITVNPSGFVFSTGYNNGISTTTFSSPSNLYLYPAILNSNLTYYTTAAISPGVAATSVPVSSSNTVVGTISASPAVFHPGDTSQFVTFQPTSAGTTTLSIVEPIVGFSTAANYTSFTATVTAPALSLYNTSLITGAGLENTNNVYLPVAPPNPVTVTVTSNGPNLTLSKDATTVGVTSITFTNVTSAGYVGTFYVQGQTTGATTVTASAPGYTNAVGTATVNPAGFAFNSTQGFTTSLTSGPQQPYVYAYSLNPGTLTLQYNLPVNPGASISVPVTSSDTTVGTISGSPLVFTPGTQYMPITFTPVATGTTTLTVVPPAGFSTPSQGQQIPATVQ